MPESDRVAGLRSVELVVPDLDAAVDFLTRVWGLSRCDLPGETVFLHGTGRDHHCVALTKGDAPGISSMTFRARGPDSLTRSLEQARAAGATDLVGPQPASDPAGGTEISFRDPQGRRVRLVHGDPLREVDTGRADVPIGLSHVNFNSTDVDAAVAFYHAALGFSLTDRSKMMGFIRCNSDHHTLVIAEAGVNTLNHIAFMLPGWEHVMRGAGRLVDHGHKIGWGVGRHGPGDNVFAYFETPMGFVMELTSDVLQVDDSYRVGGPQDWVWPPGRIDQWGIAPIPAPQLRAAQKAVPFL